MAFKAMTSPKFCCDLYCAFPGNATLVRSSQEVVKGSELTLTCLVPDLGRPKALLYKWSLGDHIVNHVTTETWTINPVTLETQVIQLLYKARFPLIVPCVSIALCIIVSEMIARAIERRRLGP